MLQYYTSDIPGLVSRAKRAPLPLSDFGPQRAHIHQRAYLHASVFLQHFSGEQDISDWFQIEECCPTDISIMGNDT